MNETVEFWIVSWEENGVRQIYREALTAEMAKAMARQMALAGFRGSTRRFVVGKRDIERLLDCESERLKVVGVI